MEIAGLRIGIRASSAADSDLLIDALSTWLVHDPDAPTNFSVRFAQRPNDLHILHWGRCVVARTRTTPALLDALANHLGGHRPRGLGVVRLHGVVVRTGQSALLYPSIDRALAWNLAARLSRGRASVDNTPYVDVVAESGVILGPQPLELSLSAREGLAQRHPSSRGERNKQRNQPTALTHVVVPPISAGNGTADAIVAIILSNLVDMTETSIADVAVLASSIRVIAPDQVASANV